MKMHLNKLEKDNKTIVFQEMIHIGSPNYYKQVRKLLQKYKKEGYVLAYEGVGKKAFDALFKRMLPGLNITYKKVLPYQLIAKIVGLSAQKSKPFLGVENQNDYRIDIKQKEFFKRLDEIKPKSKIKVGKTIDLDLDRIHSKIKTSKICKFLFPYFLSFSWFTYKFIKTDIDKLIVDERDKILANWLVKTNKSKIFVMYGAKHYEGVSKILKKNGFKETKKINSIDWTK